MTNDKNPTVIEILLCINWYLYAGDTNDTIIMNNGYKDRKIVSKFIRNPFDMIECWSNRW